MFSGIKEKFEPVYLDSEEYYKQAPSISETNNVNRFSPAEKVSSPQGKFVTGYNNPYMKGSDQYYALNNNPPPPSQQEWIQQNSLYNNKQINGIPIKDYYDKYTKDTLNNGTWFLNKDMPQDTNQYLEDSQVQQRMEIYTGLRQERDRGILGVPNKVETKNLFTPEERITGYGYQYGQNGGGPGLSITRQKEFEDLKQTIKLKTNEQPFEKIHVGPGLALGTEIPAAGGFHQYTRIMPDNISDHTANQLPGRVTGEKWLFSNAPTSQAPVVKNRPDTFYSLCQYGPMPGKSAVTAEMTRPDYAVTLKNQNRAVINYGYGVPLNSSLNSYLTS